MSIDWLAALRDCDQAGQGAVLVTVAQIRGSAPREAGCKMVVTADGVRGTIGGGALEMTCIEAAQAMLDAPDATTELRAFPLGPALGQCCGGHVSVLFEPIHPPALRIAVFGAGHVGRALVALLGTLDCRVRWIDSREEAFPPVVPANVTPILAATPDAEIANVLPGSRVLVMTHDHALDLAITRAALARDDLASVGLIGSKTKRARFLRRLGESLPPAKLARLICPIGLPGLGDKTPAEIAIAVAAQILQQKADATSPGDQMSHAEIMSCTQACAGCEAAP